MPARSRRRIPKSAVRSLLHAYRGLHAGYLPTSGVNTSLAPVSWLWGVYYKGAWRRCAAGLRAQGLSHTEIGLRIRGMTIAELSPRMPAELLAAIERWHQEAERAKSSELQAVLVRIREEIAAVLGDAGVDPDAPSQ